LGTPLEFKLLNDYQRDFPLVPRPFRFLAEQHFVSESVVIESLRRLRDEGSVSRVGAVFAPGRIGASTLVALAVPARRLAEVAALLQGLDGINHSYEREHAFNLWAVATAPDAEALAALLAHIRSEAGVPMLDLPMLEEYRIDLGFDLSGAHVGAREWIANGPRHVLSPRERRLVAHLQAGIELVPEPYRVLGMRAGMSEPAVLALLTDWVGSGVIRRFGVIVRHHELGYRANAMAVWDVPDELTSALGRKLAQAHGVTLAYRRSRVPPHWRYNLFCMLHGKAREAVLASLAEIARDIGLDRYPHAVLFSGRRFKQTGARYVSLEPAAAHG
jgi:DNA-binding Lrp family transcriptional regulator